ncbi:MAG: exo-alpha-sialidase, partial [Planctomycetes bacterium]|nr:exo-alpha-sialidase [Planctomycetota bacterium]
MPTSLRSNTCLRYLALAIAFTLCSGTVRAQFSTSASTGVVGLLNNDAIRDSGNDQRPSLATDGSGNWVAVWQTDRASTTGGDATIELRWAVSSDGGLSWSEPATVNSEAQGKGLSDTSPVVATNRKGDWVLMWVSPESGSTTQGGTTSNVLAAHSNNNGRTWSVPQRIATPSQDVAPGAAAAIDIDLALATDGFNWIAMWSSTRDISGGGGVHAPNDAVLLTAQSFDGGVTWTTAGSFTQFDSQRDAVPTIAANRSGQWMTLWTAGTNIVFSESLDGGLTFSEPVTLPASAGGANAKVASSASVASGSSKAKVTGVAGNDRWVVAFARAGDVVASSSPHVEAGSKGIASVTGANRAWSVPKTVGSGVNPFIAAGADDSWVVGWEQAGMFGDDIDILVSRSTDGGNSWGEPSALDAGANNDDGEDLAVRLATDGLGSWVAVWYSGSDTRGAGNDEDINFLPFAFSADCDDDGVGDAQASKFGDCDNDGIPDGCDSDACPQDGQNGNGSAGAGGGSAGGGAGCGAGAVGMLPLMI